MHLHLPPVYPITDKTLSDKASHLAILRELARGGACWVQIRDKTTPVRELLADLLHCVDYAAKNRIVLIIDDRCDLVMSSGAAGVHLGQLDLPPAAARRILGPDMIIGYSTHTPAQVRKAQRLPVDYIGFGPIFATATKDNPGRVVGLMGLKRACAASRKPVVAIGGIDPPQIADVLRAGAASAGVISAIMNSNNIARQMERLLKAATALAQM